MNEKVYILSIKGSHSQSTRADFVSRLKSFGATVEFGKSRLGNFEVVKVNGQAVARMFKSQLEMIQYMARA